MYKGNHFAEGAAALIEKAANAARRDLKTKKVEQEPAFTDRLLAYIQSTLDGSSIGEVICEAKTFTDRGRGSQESRFGADFMAITDIQTDETRVRKGFLAQAKLLNDAGTLYAHEVEELQSQCHKMLQYSPASYGFFYSEESIICIPALEIASLPRKVLRPIDMYNHEIQAFFLEHFKCFIGDRRFTPATLDDPSEIAREYSDLDILMLNFREAL